MGANWFPQAATAQVDEAQLGSWYMYFWDTQFKDSQWGLGGDFQHRSWDVPGDFEQRILRGGLTYRPLKTKLKITMGYAYLLSGEFGPDDETSDESRIYQDFLLPQKIGSRFYFTHRLRLEQRFVAGQDFRTRYRYNLFLNIALNNKELVKGTVYLAFYNEIFINGQHNLGNGKKVSTFDRDWLYGGLGYIINKNLKVQLAFMHQFTNDFGNGQLQFSLHHKF